MKDEFGNRMKRYEEMEAGRRLMPLLPACARIDGRSFHTFCRDLCRPFDMGLHDLMVHVMLQIGKETGARFGYTQSDEITLIWYAPDYQSQIFADGRTHKMVSLLAGLASAVFMRQLGAYLPHKNTSLGSGVASFDARVWNVPNPGEAANYVLWRSRDAIRNSIATYGRQVYGVKGIHGLNGLEIRERLERDGLSWEQLPLYHRQGTFAQHQEWETAFNAKELAVLPPKHAARSDPTLKVRRSDFRRVNLPLFGEVFNKEAVIFEGESPRIYGSLTPPPLMSIL